MTKKPTPSPDPSPRAGCFLTALFVAVIGMGIGSVGGQGLISWTLIFAIPFLVMVLFFLHEKILLVIAKHKTDFENIFGILVTSDSPNWKQYIEDTWIPKFGNSIVILNWSEHKRWRRDIYTSIFYKFIGDRHNYCPSIVLLNGLKQPLVFRFFYAFRDARHGNKNALIELEERLFGELSKRLGT